MRDAKSNGVAEADSTKELEELRQKLAKECKAREDLNKANTRLTKLISIGQDALKQEQDLVTKLQQQLQQSKKVRA